MNHSFLYGITGYCHKLFILNVLHTISVWQVADVTTLLFFIVILCSVVSSVDLDADGGGGSISSWWRRIICVACHFTSIFCPDCLKNKDLSIWCVFKINQYSLHLPKNINYFISPWENLISAWGYWISQGGYFFCGLLRFITTKA